MASPIRLWNFGKNIQLQPAHYYQPRSEDEVLKILEKHAGKKVRAIGSLHGWNASIVSDDVLVELSHLNSIEIDRDAMTVKVGGGCKLKRLLQILGQSGLTLPSHGLIDEQTVAGATATATHGSGKNSLSHYVTSITIAHYDPTSGRPILTTIVSGDKLLAARCSLGRLGVVVSVKLKCRPTYNIEEHAAFHPTLESALAKEKDYPQQQFYLMPWSWTYFGHHRKESSKSRSRLATLYRTYCFLAIDIGLHLPILFFAKILKSNWAIRFFFKRILPLAIIRNWKVIDDSHSILTMEHELFRHIEIEVFVQRDQLADAVEFLTQLLEHCARGKTQLARNPAQPLVSAPEYDSLKGCYTHHYPICLPTSPSR